MRGLCAGRDGDGVGGAVGVGVLLGLAEEGKGLGDHAGEVDARLFAVGLGVGARVAVDEEAALVSVGWGRVERPACDEAEDVAGAHGVRGLDSCVREEEEAFAPARSVGVGAPRGDLLGLQGDAGGVGAVAGDDGVDFCAVEELRAWALAAFGEAGSDDPAEVEGASVAVGALDEVAYREEGAIAGAAVMALKVRARFVVNDRLWSGLSEEVVEPAVIVVDDDEVAYAAGAWGD